MRNNRDRWLAVGVGGASLVIAAACWELASRRGVFNPVFIPSPSSIAENLYSKVVSGELLKPLMQTLETFTIAFSIASVLGITIGILMGTQEIFYNAFEPLIEAVRPIPKPALVPAFFLFLGIGKVTIMFIVTVACLFPIIINTFQGVRGLDPIVTQVGPMFQLSPLQNIIRIILPASLPMILVGLRISIGLGLILVIVAEMLAGEDGVGYLILDSERSFQTPDMFAWLTVLAAVGGILSACLGAAERVLLPWQGRD